ncbi:hypothetical protein CKAN_00408900 [Cinnamomum micranthum f. kanehirae]|uniref:Uncharacterized protein n=1 Tax=Cinnamomum micranthum f. kanehirae TaxID=337451 RepID=A0A443NB05_9MAGN|nr:hypothetical protein CKAN_00408900 [Cinnamomum micranthum f. kanehirae]
MELQNFFINQDLLKIKGIKYVCDGMIKEMLAGKGWSYNSCTFCTAGVTMIDADLTCTGCGWECPVRISRYRFTFFGLCCRQQGNRLLSLLCACIVRDFSALWYANDQLASTPSFVFYLCSV